jgi:hypothetical protein
MAIFADTGKKPTLPEAPCFIEPKLHSRFRPFIQCEIPEIPLNFSSPFYGEDIVFVPAFAAMHVMGPCC